jgi:transcription antitermination factor NusG
MTTTDERQSRRLEDVQLILKDLLKVIKVGISKGQSVRIIDGPFIDFIGVVDEINAEKGKVRVLVSFFGRETPVELDLLQIEKL